MYQTHLKYNMDKDYCTFGDFERKIFPEISKFIHKQRLSMIIYKSCVESHFRPNALSLQAIKDFLNYVHDDVLFFQQIT